MKILIIDPDQARQRSLRTILQSIGHKSSDVEGVADVKAGLVVLKKKKYDCVFSFMVDQGDLELLKDVRENSRTKTLPVISYSSQVSRELVLAASQAGTSAFLNYPFSVGDVENVIAMALKRPAT